MKLGKITKIGKVESKTLLSIGSIRIVFAKGAISGFGIQTLGGKLYICVGQYALCIKTVKTVK